MALVKYLKNDKKSVDILVAMQSHTFLKGTFGDPLKYPVASARISALLELVAGNVARVVDLGSDLTRTPVSQHLAAKALAEKTARAIQEVKGYVLMRANELQIRGQELADAAFAPRAGMGHLDSEIRSWMRDEVKTENGMVKVSALAKKDPVIAGIIYHSPHFLTGFSEKLHADMKLAAVERFVPNAWESLQEGVNLEGLAPKYDRAAADVHASFYDKGMVAKADTRVEVD